MRGLCRLLPRDVLTPKNLGLALLVLLLAYVAFAHWGKMHEPRFLWFEKPQLPELYLTSYDSVVPADGKLNFSVHVPENLSCSFCGISAPAPGEGELAVSTDPSNCPGFVNFTCGSLSVGFPYLVSSVPPPMAAEFAYFQVFPEGRELVLALAGEGRTNGYTPLHIFVDGTEAAAPLRLLNGSFAFEERVRVSPGEHNVSVSLAGASDSALVRSERPYSWTSLFVLLLSLAAAWFAARGVGARLLVFLSSLLSFLAFDFELSALGFAGVGVLALAALVVWAWRAKPGWKLEPSLARDAILFGIAWTALVALVAIWLGSFDSWGPFYYRHAEETLAQGTPHYFDSLSYLGRMSTYPPAFFDFAAGLAGLLNVPDFESIRLPVQWLLVFSWAFGMHLLFSRLDRKRRWLASLLFFSVWFLFMMSTIHSLHVYAYALLALGVVLFEFAPGLLAWFSVIPLAAAFSAHPTAFFFLPFFAWACRGFSLDWKWIKKLFLLGAGVGMLSFIFYLPIFLASGLPYEIRPSQWGYLLTYGLDGMLFEFQLLLPFILLAGLLGLRNARTRLPALALLALLLVDMFVTYRVNFLIAILAAALVPLVLLEERKPSRAALSVLVLACLASLAFGLVLHSGTKDYCTWGLANDACTAPLQYLAHYSSYDDSVAVPPLLGHLTAWVSDRKVLADLYVEYADAEQFSAVDSFYQTGRVDSLQAYNVSLVVMDKAKWPPREASDGRVLGAREKLYDNGYFSIHRLP